MCILLLGLLVGLSGQGVRPGADGAIDSVAEIELFVFEENSV